MRNKDYSQALRRIFGLFFVRRRRRWLFVCILMYFNFGLGIGIQNVFKKTSLALRLIHREIVYGAVIKARHKARHIRHFWSLFSPSYTSFLKPFLTVCSVAVTLLSSLRSLPLLVVVLASVFSLFLLCLCPFALLFLPLPFFSSCLCLSPLPLP